MSYAGPEPPAGGGVRQRPWHREKPIDEVLPSYSPQLNPIERFWKKLRRRATHNCLFDTLTDLRISLRASLPYFQTVRRKVKKQYRRTHQTEVHQKRQSRRVPV
ncbi:MAG TPA: transposase [Urbifossiella sp.]|nr:transposase [Urbifossiella sp.]